MNPTLFRFFTSGLLLMTFLASALSLSGCKQNQQAQQQLEAVETKTTDLERKVTGLETDLRKANFEISQMKSLVTKLGNVVVDIQKMEDERSKVSESKKSAAAHHGAVAAKKKSPPAKRRH